MGRLLDTRRLLIVGVYYLIYKQICLLLIVPLIIAFTKVGSNSVADVASFSES